MSDVIGKLSQVMRAEIKSLDSVANNTANVNTPGYRAERSVLDNSIFTSQLSSASGPDLNTIYSTKNGALKVTTVKTDLAIQGSAWFVINVDGEMLLSRNGRFKLNDGQLTTYNNHPVVFEGGSISISDPNFAVMENGEIYQQGKIVGRLLLVSTDSDAKMISLGNGFYRAAHFNGVSSGVKLVQGAYETSNVDTSVDMVKLMETTRRIETLQRAMSTYDNVLNIGINQLGK